MESVHFEYLYPPKTRFKEIEKIMAFLKSGSSCQLLSLPGVGRSNILGLLAYNKHVRTLHLKQQDPFVHFVIISFSELRKRSLADVMKSFFLSLVYSLKERGLDDLYEETHSIFKDVMSYQDEFVLFQGLKRAFDILITKKIRIVFLFDRFEEYIPTATPEFFTNLRSLRNYAKYHCSIVFSLTRPLEDVLDPILFADFYEFVVGNYVFVSVHDEVGLPFRIKHLESVIGKKFQPSVISETTTLTGGHGKLTRLCLEALAHHNAHPSLDFFLTQKPIQGALQEIWYSLQPLEQTMLEENTKANNDYLEQSGLLENGKITIPLLETFITKSKPQATSTSSETIVFHSETNTITKGPLVLSDILTLAEFRLLALLLEQPNTIIDREAIIHTVWKETKSLAGVTDQAIDQLVFRLRKKIEDDPYHPQFLHTIKGRGIRFSQ